MWQPENPPRDSPAGPAVAGARCDPDRDETAAAMARDGGKEEVAALRQGLRSRAVEAAPTAPYWHGGGDPALFDLYDVSLYRGRIVFHGLDETTRRALRQRLSPYEHFVANEEKRDTFDAVFEFSPEPLKLEECARVEERSTFLLSPWHPDNAYHLHVNNLVAVFANLRHADALERPRVLWLYPGDPPRNARARQLWELIAAMFDGAVEDFEELQRRAGRTALRHVRWGCGPHVFYLRDVRATAFDGVSSAYQQWVLRHYGIAPRIVRAETEARPRLRFMRREGARNIVNDALVVAACRDAGLDVEMFDAWASTSPRDLIKLLHAADGLVGVHGAALAHMAYLPAGSLVAELRTQPGPPVFAHMAPHFQHRHLAIEVSGRATAQGVEVTRETADSIARQILAAWRDRGRRRVITVRSLGTGSWGNEVFWYLFGKAYARRHGLELQVDPWSGNALIGAADPAITEQLPTVYEKTEHGVDDTVIPHAPPLADVNFEGYFQYHTSFHAPDRDYLQALFRPSEDLAAQLEPGWRRWRARGRTVVAIHVRRCDYGFSYFYRTPIRWYREQLARIWPTLDGPILYVAADAPGDVVNQFSEYDPATADDFARPLPAHDFYRDFYALQHCDVILIPNSSFSFAASMLNRGLRAAYRSHLPSRGFVPFDPWDSKPLDQGWESWVERHPGEAELWRPMPAWRRWWCSGGEHCRRWWRGGQFAFGRRATRALRRRFR